MNLIKEKLTCHICKNIFEKPVFLPCFSTVCKNHSNDFIINPCLFCQQYHMPPKEGFQLNDILNDIISSDAHLSPNEKEALNTIDKLNKDLNEIYDNLKNKENQMEVFSSDYFLNIMNKIEIQREELKLEIDVLAENLVNQTKEVKSNYENQIQKVKFSLTKEKLNEEKIKLKEELKKPITDKNYIDNLKSNSNLKIFEIKNKLQQLESIESEIKKCSIQERNTKLGKSEFGKLTLVNSRINHSLISGDNNGFIKIWSLSNGGCVKTIDLNLEKNQNRFHSVERRINCLLDLRNNLLAIGLSNGKVLILNLKSNTNLSGSHNASICSLLLLSKDVLISGSIDGVIKFWNIKNNQFKLLKEIRTLSQNIESLQLIEYAEDEIFCSKKEIDNEPIFHLFHNKILIIIENTDMMHSSILFANNYSKILRSVKILKTKYNFFSNSNILRKNLTTLSINDNFYLPLYTENIETTERNVFGNFQVNKRYFEYLVLNIHDIKDEILKIQINFTSDLLHVFQINDLKKILLKVSDSITNLKSLSDNEFLYNDHNQITLIDNQKNKSINFCGHQDQVNDLIISNNELISCSNDKTIKIWNLNDGSCIKTLTGHAHPVNTCIFVENN